MVLTIWKTLPTMAQVGMRKIWLFKRAGDQRERRAKCAEETHFPAK